MPSLSRPEARTIASIDDVTARPAKNDRLVAEWAVAMMLTVGLHLAGLGWLAQSHFANFLSSDNFGRRDFLMVSFPEAVESVELPPPLVVIQPQVTPPRRLAREMQHGVPEVETKHAVAGRLERRPLPMTPSVAWTSASTPLPRRRSAFCTLSPDVGNAPMPSGAGGERVSLKPAMGEEVAECIVYLFDNSAQDEARQVLRKTLRDRLHKLHQLQFFYVIAYDETSHRIFTSHSPELRPLPPTASNLRRTERWIDQLEPHQGVDGARWAIVHALQLRPRQVQVLSSGPWPAAASGYLRSTNQGPRGRVRVPIHFVATSRAKSQPLTTVAQENKGTLETLEVSTPRQRRDDG